MSTEDGLTAATAVSIFGIQCWDEGTREVIGRGVSYAVRKIKCKWADRIALTQKLRAPSATIGSVVVFSAGASYPAYPQLFCDTVETTGVVGGGGLTTDDVGMVAYKYAQLTATYKTLEFGGTASYDPNSVGVDFSSQIIHVPQSTSWLKYSDGGMESLPPEDSPPIIIPTATLTVPLRNLAKLPVTAIIAATEAPVNTISVFGSSIGKVFFDGGRSIRRVNVDGSTNWDLDLRFQLRTIPWNSVVSKTGAVRPVVRQDGSPLYASSDLNNLLVNA
jgi:hypothetical protein